MNTAIVIVKLAIVFFVIGVGSFLRASGELASFRAIRSERAEFLATQSWDGRSPGGQPLGMLAGAAIVFFAYIGFDSLPHMPRKPAILRGVATPSQPRRRWSYA